MLGFRGYGLVYCGYAGIMENHMEIEMENGVIRGFKV